MVIISCLACLILASGCRKTVDKAAFDLAQKPIVRSKCKGALAALMTEMNTTATAKQATGGSLTAADVPGLASFSQVRQHCGEPAVSGDTAPQVTATLFTGTAHQCTLTIGLNQDIQDTCKDA